MGCWVRASCTMMPAAPIIARRPLFSSLVRILMKASSSSAARVVGAEWLAGRSRMLKRHTRSGDRPGAMHYTHAPGMKPRGSKLREPAT
jgi:hypothetical protein